VAPGTPSVATGALTPPDTGLKPITPSTTDLLAARLQDALGPNYEVERALGSGGFAVVYLVKDLALKRKLAVKVLSPDLIASKTVLERFHREAETIAQLSHPNIVPLHFIGSKDDLVYLVMECIQGESLAERIERETRLPVDEVGRILREVAGALEHAHKRGVVHRDIKPHNVLLEAETGRALVTDFGIARTAEGSSLTASGMVVGTPAYLSPEQVMGQTIDHRADIYALGIMGYEMLTGEPPFTGPTPTAVLMKRLAEPPPAVTRLRPEVPQAVEDVIHGCLAQEPADRFQSAGEVARALGGATPVSGGHPTAEIVLKMRRARRRWSLFVAVGAVAAFAGVWTLWHFASKGSDRERVPTPDERGVVVIPGGAYTIGRDAGPAFSRPAHQVTLDSFGIDKTEVTVGQYRRFVAQTRAPVPWTAEPADTLMPVTGLTWAEAAAFCSWKHGAGGRLPSEEEWEAAARGPEARLYPWGDAWEASAANTASQRQRGPLPVGSLPRGNTASGLVDIVGNVWEWTSSRMVAYPGGTAPPDGSRYYVIRGGAFNTPDSLATATTRGYLPHAESDRSTYAGTGFRCAAPVRGTVER
jgi:formylglycine-generating enzyme required for sulfatase activity/tRNA A-37 threonylcarbamoyl transferase component Bud32